MVSNKNILVFLFVITIAPVLCYSQSKEALEKEKTKIQGELSLTNELLNQTLSGKKASSDQIVLINKKIKDRTKLISTINAEVKNIDNNISITSGNIESLNKELKILKDEYAKMIVNTWATKNTYKRLSYIFSSKDLNQAFRRITYFKHYSDTRKKYCNEIIDKSYKLQGKKIQLEQQKNDKEVLRNANEQEAIKLKAEKEQKDKTVKELTQQEKDLRKKIKKNQEALAKLNKEIEKIIADEIKSRKGAGGRIELTPEEQIISNKFEGNKRKLPWPCERGVIVETFGEKLHPELKDIKINSTGIDILTESKSIARSVFDGKVTKIINIPQYNNVVIIRHGDYLTVYSNLDVVFVSVGDQVKTKDNIGVIYSNTSEGTTKLHFEVWKGTSLLDPEDWIIGR